MKKASDAEQLHPIMFWMVKSFCVGFHLAKNSAKGSKKKSRGNSTVEEESHKLHVPGSTPGPAIKSDTLYQARED